MTRMSSLGIGIVGVGMVGQLCHLANFITIAGCRVVALAELRPLLGRRVADRFGVPRLYATHRELLADKEVEAVVVVTRRAAIGPIVLDVLRSGRHVLSEKPMAHTVEQGLRLAEQAEASGVVYSIGYMKRHDAGVQRARSLLDRLGQGSELGPLLRVHAWSLAGDAGDLGNGYEMTDEPRPEGLELWPAAPDWFPAQRSAAYDGFLNVHVHMINLMRFFIGSTPRVIRAEVNENGRGRANFDFSGVPGVLEFGASPPPGWREGLEFSFAEGAVRVDLPAPFLRHDEASVTVARSGKIETVLPGSSWAFRLQAKAFAADAREGGTPLSSGADAVEDLLVAEAIWQAVLGRPNRGS